MIPAIITQENILQAINKIDKVGYKSIRKSDDFDLVFNESIYPPKVIVSVAHSFASTDGEEWPASRFNGGDETNNYLIEKGFPILVKSRINKDNYFTDEELYFFSKYAGITYASSDLIHKNAGNFIHNVLYEKTRLWAEKLAERLDLEFEGTHQWLDRYYHSAIFRPYTWYKLFRKNAKNRNIYFTIGIDSDGTLLIKLDCQRNGKTPLPVYEQERFNELLENYKVQRKSIHLKSKDGKNWNSLLKTSVKYIKDYFSVYEACDSGTFLMQRMGARICWNDNNWKEPSGTHGKSKTSKSVIEFIHERDHGFAPEEWLFDLDKELGGFTYARIEPIHTKTNKHSGEIYNLTLYSRNSDEHQWYWVGEIDNVQVITEEMSVAIRNEFKKKKWLQERASQLKYLKENEDGCDNINPNDLLNWDPKDLFNIRFRPEDVRLFELIPFDFDEKPPSGYYNLAELKIPPKLKLQTKDKGLEHPSSKQGKTKSKIIRGRFKKEFIEIENIHGLLQDEFVEYLKLIYPGDSIVSEHRKKSYNTRVDITRTHNNTTIFYEIKTYPNVRYSIRVAIGQLLEYAFYPDQALADEFIIVTHLKPDTEDVDYLNHLNNTLGVSFGLISFDHKKGVVLYQ